MRSKATCYIESCNRPVKVRYCGLCSAHYERARLHGDVRADEPLRNDLTAGVCEAEGCSLPTRNKAPKSRWCKRHAQSVWRTGKPFPQINRPWSPEEDRHALDSGPMPPKEARHGGPSYYELTAEHIGRSRHAVKRRRRELLNAAARANEGQS